MCTDCERAFVVGFPLLAHFLQLVLSLLHFLVDGFFPLALSVARGSLTAHLLKLPQNSIRPIAPVLDVVHDRVLYGFAHEV